jgi:hypothetical protein
MKLDVNSDPHRVDMEIVDTFTRLIFAEDQGFGRREHAIVEALRCCEQTLYAGDTAAMGEFLRALGVTEMIALVSKVHAQMDTLPAARLANHGPATISATL